MAIDSVKELLRERHQTQEGASKLTMAFFALLVGIIAGFGAVVFRLMIGFIHNVMFTGRINGFYNANTHTLPSIWGIGVILVPVIGALGVAWLVKTFAPEAKGHGVPEVLDAIYLKKGKIRPVVAVVKSLASALSIGSGGSVGREGPIVQIGSAFGSMLGGVASLPSWQRGVLIAAGAAGGIAATFNTPVGALAFAIELMLTTISAVTLFPVAIATVTATYIGRMFFGPDPAFYVHALIVPHFERVPLGALLFFLFFGVFVGLLSVLFVRGLYWFEDLFDKIFSNYYVRHAVGMLVVGILLYGTMRFSGHYYLGGVGYASILDMLRGALTNPWFLLLLVLGKWLATCLTLGSGASGGIFSPALFMGAAFGACFGYTMRILFPHFALDPTVFMIAGMAGMIGSSTGAVLTGIIMINEMTHDSNLVLPIVLTVTVAYIVRKVISNESIYTLKLLRRGIAVPEGLQSAVFLTQRAKQVASESYRFVSYKKLVEAEEEYKTDLSSDAVTIITQHDKPIGIWCYPVIVDRDAVKSVDKFLERHFTTAPQETLLPKILRKMKERDVHYVLVTRSTQFNSTHDVVGIITEHEIVEYTVLASYLFSC